VTNTRGESSAELVRRLSQSGVKLNTTALLTLAQVRLMAEALRGGAPAFVSVFAGRVADTGVDPLPLMGEAVDILRDQPDLELIWSSPRELLNLFQADACGCHVITMTADLLAKLSLIGKDLTAYSVETVGMLTGDAVKAGYEL
jgi:transaldolase